MAKNTARMACPASMLAKRRTESETRRKTSLMTWMHEDELLEHRRGALRHPGGEVVDAVLANAGVVREDEGQSASVTVTFRLAVAA